MQNNILKIKQADRNKFCTYIVESSAPRGDFYFLVGLSSLIVALGLMANNIILVIGGMVVAPILSPILALALGVVINDAKVIIRSLKIFSVSFILVFILTIIVGLFSSGNIKEMELIKMMQPSLFNFFVSLVAGLAASYTWAKPNLDSTLPGIAITVTLIPPMTAVGLAVSHMEWAMSGDALKTFLLNILGITASSLIIFSLMDFYKAKSKLVEEIKLEEKELKLEKKKKEKK
ncbi:DUF389 domain-containing protein [bacterium]|nr:DUF389 domain-containing protein [bacterium]